MPLRDGRRQKNAAEDRGTGKGSLKGGETRAGLCDEGLHLSVFIDFATYCLLTS